MWWCGGIDNSTLRRAVTLRASSEGRAFLRASKMLAHFVEGWFESNHPSPPYTKKAPLKGAFFVYGGEGVCVCVTYAVVSNCKKPLYPAYLLNLAFLLVLCCSTAYRPIILF